MNIVAKRGARGRVRSHALIDDAVRSAANRLSLALTALIARRPDPP